MSQHDLPGANREYVELRDFALALAEFLDHKQPGNVRLSDSLADGFAQSEKDLSLSRRRQGARMAVSDFLEMTRDFRQELVNEADKWLAAKGVASLSTMRERIWQRIPKILARGRIRDEAEYYLLVERLNDVGPAGLKGPDRELAAAILAVFERDRPGRERRSK